MQLSDRPKGFTLNAALGDGECPEAQEDGEGGSERDDGGEEREKE